jgi:hypothetical protein
MLKLIEMVEAFDATDVEIQCKTGYSYTNMYGQKCDAHWTLSCYDMPTEEKVRTIKELGLEECEVKNFFIDDTDELVIILK